MKQLFILALAATTFALAGCKKDVPTPNDTLVAKPADVAQPAEGTVEAKAFGILDAQAQAVANDDVEAYKKAQAELDEWANSLNESDQKKADAALEKWAYTHQELEEAFNNFGDRHEAEL